MSIRIDPDACTGCGLCASVCPGSLITLEAPGGRACIRRPGDCWGCASCLKECRSGAISYFLGADIGGDGAIMSVRDEGRALEWIFRRRDGTVLRISVRRDESNAY